MTESRRPSRRERDKAAADAPAPEPESAVLSPEAALAAYRKEMNESAQRLETAIGEAGGRRDILPPIPTSEQVEARDAALAASPPHELTDEELGLGELGIPERRVRGLGAAWNFTKGPVLIYEGAATIAAIDKQADPIVLVADYIPEDELKKIEKTRIRGFVLQRGSLIDPTYWVYRDENRATVMGAEGALELAVNGEDAIVDGIRGVVYFGPSGGTVADYDYLRQIGPPAQDVLLMEGLRTLAGALMGTKIRLGEKPPFDFDQQDRLLDVAKRARAGAPITEEDDAWMKAIVLQGMPTPEDMLKKVKKPQEITVSAEKDEKDEKAGPRGRADKAGGGEAKPGDAKAGEAKAGDAKAGDAKAGAADGKKAEGAGADAGAKEADKPEDKAAARRAAREAELAAQRAARRGEKPEEKKAEEPKSAEKKPEPPPAADKDDVDPLGDMMSTP